MSTQPKDRRKTSIIDIQKMHAESTPITMVTAYDFSSASTVDAAGIDMILVGDSLGMVMLGYDSTVPVTMDEMIHHCRAVARGSRSCFLVGDMPFMSYEVSPTEAVANAGRLLKEGNMDAIKLEGGIEIATTARAISDAGIAVLGHIGLTPQSAAKLGGFRVQGRGAEDAQKLIDDALALEAAGCFGIVLEAIPAPVAAAITARLSIPTIGIGAGTDCDGQVLVYHDMLGLIDGRTPRFVKKFAELHGTIVSALQSYKEEVTNGEFPAPEHTYKMKDEEKAAFLADLSEE